MLSHNIAAYHPIDAHNHLWGKKYGQWDPQDARQLLDAAERLGIDRLCVSVPLFTDSPSPDECQAANDVVFEAMRFSKRFLGFCFVNPGYSKAALKEVERCIVKGGMAGIKLYHQYLICDPALSPLMEYAADLRVPVLMHSGKVCDSATIRAQPRLSNAFHFIKAAAMFPGVILIQGHIGGGGDWEWNLRLLELRPPAVYADISGSVSDAGIVKKTVDAIGEDRVLFATDGSFEEGVGKTLDAGLSETQLHKVFSKNMQGILARRKVV
jgi:predicted TIM-barrel fold metal-dependent hydrolase